MGCTILSPVADLVYRKANNMDFNQYQELARKTAIYPNVGNNLWYPALGLCGESGEVAERVKKLYRDFDGLPTADFVYHTKKELGDVLWYVSNLASELGFDLNDIAQENINKLSDRQNRNVLHGSGDNR